MVLLKGEFYCDGWLYQTLAGEKIPRCGAYFSASVLLRSPRTSLQRAVREHGWWRDPESSSGYPKHLCPDCRKLMRGK